MVVVCRDNGDTKRPSVTVEVCTVTGVFNRTFPFQVFTERPPNESPSEKMRPDTIIDYLDPVRFPDAVIMYLEYLVFQKKLEVRVNSGCLETFLLLYYSEVHRCGQSRKCFKSLGFFQKEKYHTHLAVLYLDAVLKLRENQNSKKEDLDKARYESSDPQ